MGDLDQVIAVGTLLVITRGCYSDSQWDGPLRVVRRFKKGRVADTFRAGFKPEYEGDRQNASDFLPWLIKEGYVEHVDGVHEWHVGDYEFDP